MAYTSSLVWDGTLTENALNFSSFFQYAEFIFVKWASRPDWSAEGDAIEIDGDLLITLEPGVKRRISLFTYLESSSVVAIPEEYSRSGFLMELVLQASFAANIQVYIVRPEEAPVDYEQLTDTVSDILSALNGNVIPLLNSITGTTAPALSANRNIPLLP